MTITFESILQVYTGKANTCCCGCAGKHTYTSRYQNESSISRGYPVLPEEVDDAAARRIFNSIINDPSAVVDEEFGFVRVETSTRVKIAYFKR